MVAVAAVLALAGLSSAQESTSPDAPGVPLRSPDRPPGGPGRKGAAPSRDTAPGGEAGATAPRPRNDPRARRQQQEWREAHPGGTYRYLDDADRRMVFATCLDERSNADMQRMLAVQTDQQAATLFDAPPDSEVFIAVATPADVRRTFSGSPSTAGMYEHPLRRIVTGDIGTALRHEWTHAMHFGHMERLGQPHAMWVQEGLAALYESYEIAGDGSVRFLPTQRHNEARKAAANRTASQLGQLLAMKPDEFMRRSQSLYPVARSVFEFMADQGKLRRWYRRYVDTFAEDRTGRRAIEDAFGMGLEEFEASWRRWVLARPAVDTTVAGGDRSVGAEVRDATDGVEVTQVARGSAAQRAGIRPGDVIVAVDGTPVRSAREWRLATSSIRVPAITVTVRRSGQRTDVTLEFDRQARRPALPDVFPAGPERAGIRAGALDTARPR